MQGYLIQCVGVLIQRMGVLIQCTDITLRNARSTSFSALAYSWSERHPYNIRTWTAIYITRFYCTKWLWVLRLHG